MRTASLAAEKHAFKFHRAARRVRAQLGHTQARPSGPRQGSSISRQPSATASRINAAISTADRRRCGSIRRSATQKTQTNPIDSRSIAARLEAGTLSARHPPREIFGRSALLVTAVSLTCTESRTQRQARFATRLSHESSCAIPATAAARSWRLPQRQTELVTSNLFIAAIFRSASHSVRPRR